MEGAVQTQCRRGWGKLDVISVPHTHTSATIYASPACTPIPHRPQLTAALCAGGVRTTVPHYTQASTSDTQHNLRTSYWQNPIRHRSRPMHKWCHTHGTGRGESHPTIPPSLPGLRSPSKSKYTLKVPNRPAVHISRRLMPNDARHGSKAREGGHGSVAQRPRRP